MERIELSYSTRDCCDRFPGLYFDFMRQLYVDASGKLCWENAVLLSTASTRIIGRHSELCIGVFQSGPQRRARAPAYGVDF